MRDGETGAQSRPMTAVKDKKLLGLAVVQRPHHVAAQILAGPGGTEPFTFDAQKAISSNGSTIRRRGLNSRQSIMRI